ncbi:MAG: hypothetical protein R3C26_23730 [Calditrichia bacterium]
MRSVHSESESALAAIPGSQFDLAFVDLKMTPIDGMVIFAGIPRTCTANNSGNYHRARLHRKRCGSDQKWCTRLSAKAVRNYLDCKFLPKKCSIFTG